jgi:hypothetical protein
MHRRGVHAESLYERDHLEDVDVDDRIMITLFSEK